MIHKIISKADEFSKKITFDDIMKASSDSKFTFDALNQF